MILPINLLSHHHKAKKIQNTRGRDIEEVVMHFRIYFTICYGMGLAWSYISAASRLVLPAWRVTMTHRPHRAVIVRQPNLYWS